jgi:NAD(P)-dependent dehydrogenase (short-subunit alcohol dehydrogenase family)
MHMDSLPEKFRAVVIGASGGIGGAMATALAANPRCGEVLAFSRSGQAPAGLEAGRLDLTDENSIAAAAKSCGEVNLVIVATGHLHGGGFQPEKDMRALTADGLAHAFAINTIGPALIAKHFLPLLPRRDRGLFACLSARVGSISDNRVGGWYGYRAAKAALNMVLMNAAIETARKRPETVILGLQPGTVDTGLSKPFQGAVKPEAIFQPEETAANLLCVVDRSRPGDSGHLYDWRGDRIPF